MKTTGIKLFFALELLFVSLLLSAQTPVKSSAPEYPEWLYQSRFKELDAKTPVKLEYNKQVKAYIDVYVVKRREHLSRIIGRSEYYFPLFEEYLSKYNLPLELKYLAVIESALDPRAKSSSGAMGLWQFLYHASRMFDLKIDSYIDERCDPVKSTDAACRYLAYLYRNLNDWQLAIAAYNGGIGVVKKAIERSGGKTNFWELQPYLPAQVKAYVPAFIAVNYVMNYYKNYDIKPVPHFIQFDDVDTVFINKPLTIKQISEAAGVDEDIVKWLNPVFIKDFIPAADLPVRIFLPKSAVKEFISNEPSLSPTEKPVVNYVPVGDTTNRMKTLCVVKKGEFFHKLAIRYNCRVDDIVFWNGLKNKNIYPGQTLIVWKPVRNNGFFIVDEVFGKSKKNINFNYTFNNKNRKLFHKNIKP
ncbi:MAG: transglycosylase SLT domain-containing protein [Chlorobi bacterium]|nr:transglycosylase SLT domain-containing protein [Chlorobiota bacterium]